MEIQNENSLIHAMKTGINVFVGAGFSLYAYDKKKQNLPSGNGLADELKSMFNVKAASLSMISTILQRKAKTEFKAFLTERFSVDSYESFYNNLNLVNVKSYFTTNIDNLIPKIVSAENSKRFINDLLVNGENADANRINYLPLHGCVENPENEYVFDVQSLATTFGNNSRIWSYLSNACEKNPTIFLGYSYSDNSVIQALSSYRTFENAQKEKWILLYNPTDDQIEFYEALDFTIIKGEIKEFLELLPNILDNEELSGKKNEEEEIRDIFKNNLVPLDNRNQVSRPIIDFFRGQVPIWSDILSNKIYRVSYYKQIQDSIYNQNRQTIVIGAPVSGKTTLAMLLAYNVQFEGVKLMYSGLTLSKVDFILKILGNLKALIFVENFTDNIEAFLKLSQAKNITVVGVDRSQFYSTVSHMLTPQMFDIINVTELSDNDIQGVFNSVPVEIKASSMKTKRKSKDIYAADSIYEFVIRNIKGQNIVERYKKIIHDLEHDDSNLMEFLLLCAYMHKCRVPLSIEVAYSYFSDIYNYQDVLEMKDELEDMLSEFEGSNDLLDSSIEYYYPRTYFIAEAILKYSSPLLLKKIMSKVIDNVPKYLIYNFKTFRKFAFDSLLTAKAFVDWKDGMDFYKSAYLYDNENPYVLQQGALFLSKKKQYQEAFKWIDKAINSTNDKYFSIRNSHAIILFDANYELELNNMVEEQLDRSMEILHKCYHDDSRKIFHAIVYADQAERYFIKVNSEKTINYLQQAKKWLKEESSNNSWNYELKQRLSKVEKILATL
uniref:SIR2 family protein n=1 Tax=Prevotella sp. TaxID=59823 RepID=UPI004027C3B8